MVADEVLVHGTGILGVSEGGILILNELDRDLGEDEVRVWDGVFAEGRLVLAGVAADFVGAEGVLTTMKTTMTRQERAALIQIPSLIPMPSIH